MAEEFNIVDIWVGDFSSKVIANDYFEETYNDDDETAISAFAGDQCEFFIDHDFMESSHFERIRNIEKMLQEHSFSQSYVATAKEAYKNCGQPEGNCILLVFGREVENPKSIQKPNYKLHYIGRFDCDPSMDAMPALGDIGPPAQVAMILPEGKTILIGGKVTDRIIITGHGMTLGCGGSGKYYTDLSELVGEDALNKKQTRVFQNELDQWVVEDLLTADQHGPMQFCPVHIGPITFEWTFRV
jgi:hypothetical protein